MKALSEIVLKKTKADERNRQETKIFEDQTIITYLLFTKANQYADLPTPQFPPIAPVIGHHWAESDSILFTYL